MSYTYKRATVKDIDLLTKTRIEVLRAANKLSDDIDMSEVEKQSYNYYLRALVDGTHTAYLVFDNETSALIFYNKGSKRSDGISVGTQ